MLKRFFTLFACAVLLSLIACSNTADLIGSDDELTEMLEDYSRYTINNYNYRLVEITSHGEISGFKHYYEISSGGEVFYNGIHEGVEPKFTDIGNGIVRLELPCGSNCKQIRYFDTDNKSISEEFFVASGFTDYTNGSGSRLLARFILDDTTQEPVLVIQDIFTSEVLTRIERSFVSIFKGANFMVFLNDSEIYIDCDIVTGATAHEYTHENKGDIDIIREIVAF